MKAAEDTAAAELNSLREQLSHATGEASEAGQELARLRGQVEGLRAEATEAESKHEVELRDKGDKLVEAQAQVRVGGGVGRVFLWHRPR